MDIHHIKPKIGPDIAGGRDFGPAHLKLLAAICRSPWCSTRQMSDEAGLPHDVVEAHCASLFGTNTLQRVAVLMGEQPTFLYAPTQSGLSRIADQLHLPTVVWVTRTLQSEARFGAMRASLDAVRSTYMLCARLLRSRLAHSEQVCWDLFLPRQYRGAGIFLHARINISPVNERITPLAGMPQDNISMEAPPTSRAPSASRALYLLVDGDQHSVWVWWRHLRYMQEWSRQTNESFPPLLYVTSLTQRALSLAGLARQLAPDVLVAVSGDLDVALSQGPEAARWFVTSSAGQASGQLKVRACQPFEPGWSLAGQGIQTKHRVRTVQDLLVRSRTRQVDAPASGVDYAWLGKQSDKSKPIEAWAMLSPQAKRTLAFLSHHSVCPLSVLMTFLNLTPDQIGPLAGILVSEGLAEWVDAANGAQSPYLSATEMGATAHFQAKGAPSVERLVQRYRAGHADHVRRLAHTTGVYDFFERLQNHVQGWDRVSLKLDALQGECNEGEVGACELEEFEEDIACSAVFLSFGAKRHWMPDAFGTLRQGHERRSFWLEMDGSSAGRAHGSADIWERKLGAMFAYYRTDKWKLRHRQFPQLLIVTTDLRIRQVVQDVYDHVHAAHQSPRLAVYLTSSILVAEHGPLAPIWFKVHDPSTNEQHHAFAPLVDAKHGSNVTTSRP
jgi:hypothetical protein